MPSALVLVVGMWASVEATEACARWFNGFAQAVTSAGRAKLRPSDYFGSEDDALDFDLLDRLRTRPSTEYTDVEAATALAELMSQEFLLYGTNGEHHITDEGSRAGMRTLAALTKRLNVEWKPQFVDFPSFRAYWVAHNGYRNWNARREMVSDLFGPLREHLEALDGEAEPQPNPITPRTTPATAEVRSDHTMTALGRLSGTAPSDRRSPSGRSVVGATPVSNSQPATSARATRVFLVHGHDHNRREAVARFVEKLGFEAVILADQPDQGRTIIEKFEAHTDVEYAIVVMTPDDVGGARGGKARARARQNVILEHGFFVGLLGRRKVAALVVGDIEKPSDLSGVLYIPWDEAQAWRGRLAREMKAAGLPVDMNRL